MGLPPRFNFAEHLFGLNRCRAQRTAYIDDRGSLAYGALEDRARRLASALASAGVRREERVLLLMLDSSDWPVAFLGCLYAGVVPVAVNTLLTADDYAYMLDHSRAQAAIVSGALLGVLQDAMGRAPHEVDEQLVEMERLGLVYATDILKHDPEGFCVNVKWALPHVIVHQHRTLQDGSPASAAARDEVTLGDAIVGINGVWVGDSPQLWSSLAAEVVGVRACS